MISIIKTTLVVLLLSIFIVACGGDSQTSKDTNRPSFSWDNVIASNNYYPSGGVTNTTPTFMWPAVLGATTYQFGHEDVNTLERWHEYTVSADQAKCVKQNSCSYTPQDITFSLDEHKVWWVRGKDAEGWKDWSTPFVFKIIKTNAIPKLIKPFGEITSSQPTFVWGFNKSDTAYQLGFESNTGNDWKSNNIDIKQANCSATECSYKPDVDFISNVKYTWSVRSEANGKWGAWSAGADFFIETEVVEPPTIPKAIKPLGKITSLQPTFVWTFNQGDTDYELGLENKVDNVWVSFDLNTKQANCSATQCSYKPDIDFIPSVKNTWRVKSKANEKWGEWSNKVEFFIDNKAASLEIIKHRIITKICTKSVLSQVVNAEKEYQVFNATTFTDEQLYWANNLSEVNKIILPLACDAVVNNKSTDKAVNLLHYWAKKYELDNENRKKYFIKSNQEKMLVNNSTYDYASKNIRNAGALLIKNISNLQEKNTIETHLNKDLLYNDYKSFKKDSFIFNTDYLYNSATALLSNIVLNNNKDLVLFSSYLEKIIEPTAGWKDGFKVDGLGFHHGIHYNAYMYAYNPLIDILSYLDKTPYQINREKYLFFRDAIYNMSLMGMNKDELPSLGGRHPFYISFPISKKSILSMMETGGSILGGSLDTKLASMYYRLWKNDEYRKYYNKSLSEGFWQFNYGSLGLFRKNNWLVGLHGFNYSFKGGEISPKSSGKNMYGRYQNYGTIEVMYEGGKKNSGFPTSLPKSNSSPDLKMADSEGFGWDWNRWPGTTSIVLPWDKLLPEMGSGASTSELTNKKFSGALRFQDKKSGIFAMDFQQIDLNRINHTKTFTFKKSVFAFDDVLVALGSSINNDDIENPTITTLFQNHNEEAYRKVIVDKVGEIDLTTYLNTFESKEHRWLIDAYGTGYYFNLDTRFTLRIGEQESPNRIDVTASMVNSTRGRYATAWIEHGKAPKNENYYYHIVLNATPEKMNKLVKNYSVPHLNSRIHMVEVNDNVMAYALFEAQDNIDIGILKATTQPVLAMYEKQGDILKLTVVNPDLGYKYLQSLDAIESKIIDVTLKGVWTIEPKSQKAYVVDTINNKTKIRLTTHDGLPIDIYLSKK